MKHKKYIHIETQLDDEIYETTQPIANDLSDLAIVQLEENFVWDVAFKVFNTFDTNAIDNDVIDELRANAITSTYYTCEKCHRPKILPKRPTNLYEKALDKVLEHLDCFACPFHSECGKLYNRGKCKELFIKSVQ